MLAIDRIDNLYKKNRSLLVAVGVHLQQSKFSSIRWQAISLNDVVAQRSKRINGKKIAQKKSIFPNNIAQCLATLSFFPHFMQRLTNCTFFRGIA